MLSTWRDSRLRMKQQSGAPSPLPLLQPVGEHGTASAYSLSKCDAEACAMSLGKAVLMLKALWGPRFSKLTCVHLLPVALLCCKV